MAVEATEAEDRSYELPLEERRKLFDDLARSHLGISGEEFLRKYEAGCWPNPDDDPSVMQLVMMRFLAS